MTSVDLRTPGRPSTAPHTQLCGRSLRAPAAQCPDGVARAGHPGDVGRNQVDRGVAAGNDAAHIAHAGGLLDPKDDGRRGPACGHFVVGDHGTAASPERTTVVPAVVFRKIHLVARRTAPENVGACAPGPARFADPSRLSRGDGGPGTAVNPLHRCTALVPVNKGQSGVGRAAAAFRAPRNPPRKVGKKTIPALSEAGGLPRGPATKQ